MIVRKGYMYKMRPTGDQEQALRQAIGNARFVYNWCIRERDKAWEERNTYLSYVEQSRMITELKKADGYEWLGLSAFEPLQQAARCADAAYNNFFRSVKKAKGAKSKKLESDHPKLKKKTHGGTAKFISNVKFDFEEWNVRVPRIGWIGICKNRPFNKEKCKIHTLTVRLTSTGEFYCSIAVDEEIPDPPKATVDRETTVGIDMGLGDYAVLSDGTKIGKPKFYSSSGDRLEGLHKWMSRTEKGSNRRKEALMAIAKEYQHRRNQRNDYIHKLTTGLVRSDYVTFAIEDLGVENMMRNHKLARAISDASWSEFRRKLEYKCAWSGKNVIVIDRFAPSTKTCSVCGFKLDTISLSVREWVCPICGARHDRDVNAAANIKNIALNEYFLRASGSTDGTRESTERQDRSVNPQG